MDESMLLQRRALLQQQLSLLDDRCAATSKILGRKTQGAKARRRLEAARSGNPAVAANARGAGPPRRALAEAATTFHREAPPSTIVRPRPKPGGPQESLRLTQLMRRTARHVDVAKQVQLRRPKRGPVPRRAGSSPTNRGDAAAATRIFRGVAATPRPRRGYSVETSRGGRDAGDSVETGARRRSPASSGRRRSNKLCSQSATNEGSCPAPSSTVARRTR